MRTAWGLVRACCCHHCIAPNGLPGSTVARRARRAKFSPVFPELSPFSPHFWFPC